MKVSLLKCEDYNYEKVRETIVKSIENIGGIDKYINKGDRVLLKANLILKKRPEEAATTNPIFVRAVADILIKYGAKVVIGDSPGGVFKESRMRNIYKSTGMTEAANNTGSQLNCNLKSTIIDNPEGKILRKIVVTDMINDVDKIINLPKLKTHGLATYTGAVKNLFGLIPGTTKAEYHVRMPDINDFSDALIDICIAAKPVLHIMDGIIGMEGAGPSAGDPRKIGVILASQSPYHLDKAASKIIGLNLDEVPTIMQSAKRGLCSEDMNDFDIIGSELKDCVIKDFKKPPVSRGNIGIVPKPIIRFASKNLKSKPVFDYSTCVGCRECAENCPPKVIKMVNNKPEVDYSKCIRCFCCQELCPQKAVSIKQPLLAKLIFRL